MVDKRTLSEVKGATINLFSRQWLKNFRSIQNLVEKNSGVKALGGKFNTTPAVVIGAGPSLDKNVKYLKYVSGRALIIACDAALKVVLNEGIRPDLVTTLDPQADILRFFDGVNTHNLNLVAPTIAHPELIKSWKGTLLFYNKFAPDIPELVTIQKAASGVGELIPGGTVLSISYSLAFQAGANPITFIGQDLSYPKGQTYSSGSVYEEQTLEETKTLQKENMMKDTGLFGEELDTVKSMYITKQWMEWAFSSWKRPVGTDVLNSTEGGILKKKCRVVPFKQFIQMHADKSFNLAWKIKKLIR
ncbi:MAG: motility associated factor glycosyltransferase family protein [Nitrospinota bacterium]